ncbi:MAG: hypothetical protein K6G85_02635 [Eubacterium sp.]|nr:hypothetical protein [Eubacterium sp.]
MKNKIYQGQIKNGYGGIRECDSYVKDRYGGAYSLEKEKELPLEPFSMREISTDKNNCVLTGITRIILYHLKRKVSVGAIYCQVKAIATQKGFSTKKGLPFHKIRGVLKLVAEAFGLQSCRVKSVYLFRIFHAVKKEIDAGNPVLLNISWGYYKNHTVTGIGYRIYKRNRRTCLFIVVYDGWTNQKMFLDVRRFWVPKSLTILQRTQ